MRFGKIPDPLNPSRQVFYHAAKASDPMTYGHLGRVEIGLDASAGAIAKSGVTYWIASEMFIPSSRWSGGDGTLLQVHQSDSSNPSTGPWLFGYDPGQLFAPYSGAYVATQLNTVAGSTSQPSSAYPWASDTGGAYGFNYAFPKDQWVKVVCKYRGDPVGTTGLLQIWVTTAAGATTQIVNQSNVQIGIATLTNSDYVKSGLDDLAGGGSGEWELRRSLYLYQDNGNSEPQIRALMQ